MPPAVMTPWAQISGSLPPLIPAPVQAPPGMEQIPDDSGLPDVPQAKPKSAVWAPVDAGKQVPKEAADRISANTDPMGAEQQSLGGRLEQDYQKDLHPWGSPGSEHPGVFGKILHGLNVATGGENRRHWEETSLQKSLNDLVKERAGVDETEATTGKTKEETAEMPAKEASEEGLQGATTKNLESEARDRDATAAQGPSLATAYAHAVQSAISAGRDPSQDPIVQHISDAIQGIQKQPQAQIGTKVIQREVGGKPHNELVDERTGDDIKDLGETGEKPPVVRVETAGEQRGAKNDLLKAYQPTLDSAERMNVMTESYEKAVKDHDQQAMLNLLANHLGMTMGLQKGARLTKDIINEAKQSQPWLQGMESKFDKDGYLAGVTLSPNQMRQMVSLGQERYAEDTKKSRSTAQYLGAKDDGPERAPGRATMNYYLGLNNGDPTKAKQMAAQDGWTVK